MHVYMCMCAHVCMWALVFAYAYMRVCCMHVCVHSHVPVCAYMHLYVHACLCACLCVHVCAHVHVYACVYMGLHVCHNITQGAVAMALRLSWWRACLSIHKAWAWTVASHTPGMVTHDYNLSTWEVETGGLDVHMFKVILSYIKHGRLAAETW